MGIEFGDCETCFWFDYNEGDADGMCFVDPPVMFVSDNPLFSEVQWVRPRVQTYDRCGRYLDGERTKAVQAVYEQTISEAIKVGFDQGLGHGRDRTSQG